MKRSPERKPNVPCKKHKKLIQAEQNSLPEDMWVSIAVNLKKIKDILNFQSVCIKFYNLIQNNMTMSSLFEEIGQNVKMPLNWRSDLKFANEKVIDFLKENKRIQALYPLEIIKAFGDISKFATIPIFYLGKKLLIQKDISSIKAEELKGHALWRGTDISEKAFIILCAKNERGNLLIQSLSNQDEDQLNFTKWTTKGDMILSGASSFMNSQLCDNLKNLITNGECGSFQRRILTNQK